MADIMFENLAEAISSAMRPLSNGHLHCIPYSRALLDFFELRGKTATPLVVRCVILGRPTPATQWWNPNTLQKVITYAREAPHANDTIEVALPQQGAMPPPKIKVPYRTLGFAHSHDSGDHTLGGYENGAWLGHLVVVCENTVIDLTIGQLNDTKFAIDITPPYITIEADVPFLTGKAPVVGIRTDGSAIAYFAFPDERTYEKSDSWVNVDFRKQLHEVAQDVVIQFGGKSDEALHQAKENL